MLSELARPDLPVLLQKINTSNQPLTARGGHLEVLHGAHSIWLGPLLSWPTWVYVKLLMRAEETACAWGQVASRLLLTLAT